MVGKLFSTDGVRGVANQGLMTAEIVLKLGMAIGTFLRHHNGHNLVVIGKDTRLSGYMLESALISGFTSVGSDVILVGPMPTPAISMLVKSLRANIGIMISASHNPYQDNGIKVFNKNGVKLSKFEEKEIENLVCNYPSNIAFASPDKIGRARRLDDAAGRYIEFAKNSFARDLTLKGMKIVVDSANGAAYHLASKIFWELGADVIAIGNNPNGFNINHNCGSTDTRALKENVMKHKADLGIALDGDADRLILVDNEGEIVNGDRIISALAIAMKERNLLKNNFVVATVMSNLGMENFLQLNGIKLQRVDVGDRYVYSAIDDGGYSLGGEQSGHIIIPDISPAGDGIIASLQILQYFLYSQKKTIGEFFDLYDDVPQILHNIKCNREIIEHYLLQEKIKEIEKRMGGAGRVLVRNSGTEPLIRIMVEHYDMGIAQLLVEEVSQIVSNIKNLI